ncbi:hypothetical protein [Cerasicoccus maritimus]|uniref:hypothetical protein n=1 Tax=Cerasicoccus maritimus TaxID=490089 RepID=UPI00285298FF|nr:hypothetical protein [Cerasicoccus maritimus]
MTPLEQLMQDVYDSAQSSQVLLYDKTTWTAAYLAHNPVDDKAVHQLIRELMAFLENRLLDVGEQITFFLNSQTDEAVCHISEQYLVFFIFKGHLLSKSDVLGFVDRLISQLGEFQLNEADFEKKNVRFLKLKGAPSTRPSPVKQAIKYPRPRTLPKPRKRSVW